MGSMTLPTDAKARKAIPVYSGFIKYFPRAIAAVAELSRIGNDQHNPGKPLHWDRSKSTDELDALMRHMLDDAQGVPVDTDEVLHATKMAWRAMANLEKTLEALEVAPNVTVSGAGISVHAVEPEPWTPKVGDRVIADGVSTTGSILAGVKAEVFNTICGSQYAMIMAGTQMHIFHVSYLQPDPSPVDPR
jgi:hypothetical protein